jgi:phosphoribosylformylglycinamidine synthase
VLLLGETREELSGSEWAHVVHGHLGGLPPAVDLAAEQALASLMVDAARDGAVTSAHDVSDGGLAQALAESVMRHGVGARIELEGDPFVALFAESAARAVVTVGDDTRAAFEAACTSYGVPVVAIGTTVGTTLDVDGAFSVTVDDLRAAWTATLPTALA